MMSNWERMKGLQSYALAGVVNRIQMLLDRRCNQRVHMEAKVIFQQNQNYMEVEKDL